MERIMKYINRIYRASLIDREEAFKEQGLCGCQISYVRLICSFEGLSQDEIAKFLFVNKSTVTRQLKQLEKNGFVEKRIDQDDRRTRRIYPSEKARLLYPEIIDYLNNWNNKITKDIDELTYDKMLEILRVLAKSSSQAIGDDRL